MLYLVAGSRTWTEREPLYHDLTMLADNDADFRVITGTRALAAQGDCPIGADRIAHWFCLKLVLPCTIIEPMWAMHGAAAGPIRNRAMLDAAPDMVLAYWDGISPGTKDLLDEAGRRVIPCLLRRDPSRTRSRFGKDI